MAIVFCLCISGVSISQPMELPGIKLPPTSYQNCAAILLDGKVLTKEFFQNEKARMAQGMTGKMTVASVSTTDSSVIPINNIRFQIAIKNNRTNTMWIYSKDDQMEVRLEDILEYCEQDDSIIIMPVDQRYSLSLHEMRVAVGC